MPSLDHDFQACLFDMDGTLIDSEHVWVLAIQHALAGRGVALPEEEVAHLEYGRAWQDIFEDITRCWPHAFASRSEMERETGAFYNEYIREHDIAIPGSVALLKRLHAAGKRVTIVSGSLRERIAQTLDMLGIVDLVPFYTGCGDYEHGKPAPDCFLMSAAALGVPPEACVVFEDATAGVQAAKAAGMRCVALQLPNAPFPQDLSQADLVLPDLSLFSI
ncbi:MAG: HAD family phosphatase [Victivallales bacterium]|nr:HAD family phosphatase [Victivallales bacterium]